MSSSKSMDIFEETERKPTNVAFLYVKGVFLLILVGFLAYSYVHSDTNRLEIGYDDCGNVCGFPNKPDERLACKGADKTNEKYVVTENGKTRCVTKCEDAKQFTPTAGFQCLTQTEKQDITAGHLAEYTRSFTADMKQNIWRILITLAFACVFSALTLLLFRHFIKYIVWTILLVFTVFLISICVIGWISYFEKPDPSASGTDPKHQDRSILGAIIATVVAVAVPIVIFIFRREIRFTIRLLKEAGKAIIDMSLLMVVPFGTTILLVTTAYLWLQFIVMIASAGILQVVDGKAEYKPNGAMVFAQVLNCLGFVWFSSFLFGCQHLIVSGAIGKWFFTRVKTNSNNFVMLSTDNLIRFHLGTAVFGSLVAVIVSFIRMLVKSLINSMKDRGMCVDFIGGIFDSMLQFLEYLSKTAYICTAMFGYPFFQAGKKAFHVIFQNAKDIIIIKTVGNMVMATGKIFILVCSLIFGIFLVTGHVSEENRIYLGVLMGLLCFLLAHCFISVLEMALDTVFISFCEDCERNDGRNNPYFMSAKLVKFLEDTSVLEKQGMEV